MSKTGEATVHAAPNHVAWFSRDELESAVGQRILATHSVLDIGCGLRPQTFFRPHVHICCEPHSEYVQLLQSWFTGIAGFIAVQSTGQEFLESLPARSIDSIFMLDVIEHIEKDAGRLLLQEAARVARRQVVVFTPLGFVPQEYEDKEADGWGLGGAKWQRHLSGWTPDDFDDDWEVLGSREFHEVNGKGEKVDSSGAFWAILTIAASETPTASFAGCDGVVLSNPLLTNIEHVDLCQRLQAEYRKGRCVPLMSESRDAYALTRMYGRLPGISNFAQTIAVAQRAVDEDPPGHMGIVGRVQSVLRRSRAIRAQLEHHGCRRVIAFTSDLFDLAAAWRAARRLRLPLVVIANDRSYISMVSTGEAIAKRLVKKILVDAAFVVTSNEQGKEAIRGFCRSANAVVCNNIEQARDLDLPWITNVSE